MEWGLSGRRDYRVEELPLLTQVFCIKEDRSGSYMTRGNLLWTVGDGIRARMNWIRPLRISKYLRAKLIFRISNRRQIQILEQGNIDLKDHLKGLGLSLVSLSMLLISWAKWANFHNSLLKTLMIVTINQNLDPLTSRRPS